MILLAASDLLLIVDDELALVDALEEALEIEVVEGDATADVVLPPVLFNEEP